MKITVLNGSPKGDASVTMQYVKNMQKNFPEHTFHIVNIAQQIRQIEKDPGRFDGIIGGVSASDGVLWAFPLYVCVVHSNYMRFIELIGERGAEAAFAGKYAAALSTSIKFFDHTAHSYMRAVCDDLGMKYTGFFSAAMDDLLDEDCRAKLKYFTADFLNHIQNSLPTQRLYAPVRAETAKYTPGTPPTQAGNAGLKTLLITDGAAEGSNLAAMTARLQASFTSPVEVVDLSKADIKGGCLGCIRCGYSNECAYDGHDDIREIYNEKIRNADIIILAGALSGRFLSARFKMFIDRRFLNTHQPQMVGKQLAYLVSGPLGQNQNICEVLQAIAEMDKANLLGIVTDECGSTELDALIDSLASRLVSAAKAHYVQPSTFLGVAGLKIFRDEIYGNLRFVFRGDHLYYKKHGVYDFPQKLINVRIRNAVMSLLLKIKPVREQMRAEMPKHMAEPFNKING